MIPTMSGDRAIAYRVFKGEIEKIMFMKKSPPDNTNPEHISGIEALVVNYMRQRMEEMEKKGHFWDDYAPSTRDELIKHKETQTPEEDYGDSGRRT